MSARRASVVVAAFLGAAWLLVACGPWLLKGYWNSFGWFPDVQTVARPHAPGSDVVSIVPFLFRSLGLAVFAVLLVEAAKAIVFASGLHVRVRGFIAISAFQGVLILEALRLYAYDWLLHIFSLIGLVRLREGVTIGDGTLLTSRLPWLSFPFLALALMLVVRSSEALREAPGASRKP